MTQLRPDLVGIDTAIIPRPWVWSRSTIPPPKRIFLPGEALPKKKLD
jgi:hypothetical protein